MTGTDWLIGGILCVVVFGLLGAAVVGVINIRDYEKQCAAAGGIVVRMPSGYECIKATVVKP